jgi:hypothetical protein
MIIRRQHEMIHAVCIYVTSTFTIPALERN